MSADESGRMKYVDNYSQLLVTGDKLPWSERNILVKRRKIQISDQFLWTLRVITRKYANYADYVEWSRLRDSRHSHVIAN